MTTEGVRYAVIHLDGDDSYGVVWEYEVKGVPHVSIAYRGMTHDEAVDTVKELTELRQSRSRREIYHLNEYETDRSFGGREEGGWWFDTGRYVQCHGTFPDRASAEAKRDELEGYLATKREGLHEPSSVLSEGQWPELQIEDHPGRDYPEGRPTYE